MKIDIRCVHFNLDEKTRNYAAEKIGRLEKYYKNIIGVEITLAEHKGDTADVRYECKVKVMIPGQDLFAKEEGRDIFSIIDIIENTLREQIIKTKSKSNPNKIHQARQWVRGFFGK